MQTETTIKTWRSALLALLVAAGCVSPVPSATASGTATAPPATSLPASIGPAASGVAEIEGLVEAMSVAVLAGDRDRYLALVDQADPVFAVEHVRWVDDWSGRKPATVFALAVSEVDIDGDSAVGRLNVEWSTDPATSASAPRAAAFAATFTRSGGGWRYAGEAWTSTEIPKFVIRVAPGLESEATTIAADLPNVYDGVTAALDYEPAGTMEIKLYADAPALVANTLLSLPDIAGWNEPGEALKLVHSPDGPPLTPTIAHELSHFLGFDRAGTQRTRMPWWLDEGVATYVAAQVSGLPADDRLAEVSQWAAQDALAPWDAIAVFEETPLELWPYVYSQGYALVRFVTERHGEGLRNAWLAAMATELDLDKATSAELGRTFDELDAEFRDWLATQR